jgi:hypothetical protein
VWLSELPLLRELILEESADDERDQAERLLGQLAALEHQRHSCRRPATVLQLTPGEASPLAARAIARLRG